MATLTFTPETLNDLITDLRDFFQTTALDDDNKFRRRVLTLKDGYSLSILTGSHLYHSVEVALMKDDRIVDDGGYDIIDFKSLRAAVLALKYICRHYHDTDIIEIWHDASDYAYTR